jgi:polyisoprenoid-binding protein YceI
MNHRNENAMHAAENTSADVSFAHEARENHGSPAPRTTYRIDPAASRVEFTIWKRRFFVTHRLVTGRFTEVQGTITLDEREPANSRAEVTIGAASLTTGNDNPGRLQAMEVRKRDAHLRRADFFDVAHYPHLTFRSRRIEPIDRAAGRYCVTGELTVRGVTREVTLDATYVPATSDGPGRRIALALTGPLNRRDFGMIWNRSYLVIADDLVVTIAVEANRP